MIMTPYKRKLTSSEIEMCELIIDNPFIKISEMCRKYHTDDSSIRKCLTTYLGIVESIKFFANREKMRFDITDSKIEEAKKLLRRGVNEIQIMKSCNIAPKNLRIANYNNGTPISQVRINLMSVSWEQGKSIEEICKQFKLGPHKFASRDRLNSDSDSHILRGRIWHRNQLETMKEKNRIKNESNRN